MSSGSYIQAAVKCPFYLHDDANRIVCEGIVDGSRLVIHYDRRSDKRQQQQIFCCEHYQHCEIYRMLMESKYEEE